VWDFIDNFFLDFNISFIPSGENIMVDSLAISTSNFRVPFPLKIRYDVEVNYKPSLPDNVKHWKVFEDALDHIKIFLDTFDEFYVLRIDQEQDSESNPLADVFLKTIANHHIV
jgi:hypothetical protein